MGWGEPIGPSAAGQRLPDEHDAAVLGAGIALSDAVRRFLARRQTRRVIDAGLLHADVVADLEAAHESMLAARVRRVRAARSDG